MLFSYFGSLVRAFVCWKKCVIFSIKFFVDNLVIVLLDIHLVNGVCELKLYDKREDFPFNIVQYQYVQYQYVHYSSNVPRCILYGIFGTQVIRYFRINNIFENFKLRVFNLVEHCIELGYNFKLLVNMYLKVCRRHKFAVKYDHVNPSIVYKLLEIKKFL